MTTFRDLALAVFLFVASVMTAMVGFSVTEYLRVETEWRSGAIEAMGRPAPHLSQFYRSGHAAGVEKK